MSCFLFWILVENQLSVQLMSFKNLFICYYIKTLVFPNDLPHKFNKFYETHENYLRWQYH